MGLTPPVICINDNSGERKSAERLEDTKAGYAKGDRVLDTRQILKQQQQPPHVVSVIVFSSFRYLFHASIVRGGIVIRGFCSVLSNVILAIMNLLMHHR